MVQRPDLPYAMRMDLHLTAEQMPSVMALWHGLSWRDRFSPAMQHILARHGGTQSVVLTTPASRSDRAYVRACLDFCRVVCRLRLLVCGMAP